MYCLLFRVKKKKQFDKKMYFNNFLGVFNIFITNFF